MILRWSFSEYNKAYQSPWKGAIWIHNHVLSSHIASKTHNLFCINTLQGKELEARTNIRKDKWIENAYNCRVVHLSWCIPRSSPKHHNHLHITLTNIIPYFCINIKKTFKSLFHKHKKLRFVKIKLVASFKLR